MASKAVQFDRRLDELGRAFAGVRRPGRGWIKAIREALGMTTAQFARRLGVKQPRIIRLEQAEIDGALTLESLERAAQALGCRLVYVLVPESPLSETMRARAAALADTRLASIEHTMRLEDQAVKDNARREEAREQIIAEFLRKPARLWDDP